MAIKSPQTYADYYWAMQVEAAEETAKASEKELSQLASRVIANLGMRDVIPDELSPLFDAIEAPAGAFLGEVGGRFVSEIADGTVTQSASPFFDAIRYAAYTKFPTKKMSPVSTATLYSRGKITQELFNERFRMEGFEPLEAQFQYDAMRSYPSIPDIITWARYHGDPTNIRGTVWDKIDVDEDDFEMWEWLGLQKLTTDQAHTLFRRGKFTDGDLSSELGRIGWRREDMQLVIDSAWSLPNALLMIQGDLVQGQELPQIIADISKADIDPAYAQLYLDAVLTKPSTSDIVSYQLRKDPGLAGLETSLARIGIHPNYTEVYKELAYVIPPVADIITMAVREAFTPAIAERFGQYEDFPAPFAEWAAKKGLTREWAERYWASHWTLPSTTQGFDMLHRGIIGLDELKLLLRALDVMPFWRERLIDVAYSPLTRIDVRRMYREGILTRDQVSRAYLDIGYNEVNAKRLTDFTVKEALAVVSKFTVRDVVAAFAKRQIDRAEASSLLSGMDLTRENITYTLDRADHKRQWDLSKERVKAVRNLYRKGHVTETQTRSQLAALDVPADQITVLLEQWEFEKEGIQRPCWSVAQTLKFAKEGLISDTRAVTELKRRGFDDEHIAVYMSSIT